MGKRKSIVIVAEGALDRNLNPIKPDHVKDILVDRLGLDTRVTTLGHTQRGGKPCAYDRILPTLQGVEAVEALLSATPETPSYMIGTQENKITKVPLLEAVAQVSHRGSRPKGQRGSWSDASCGCGNREQGLCKGNVVPRFRVPGLAPGIQDQFIVVRQRPRSP